MASSQATYPPGPRMPMPLQTLQLVRDPVGFTQRCAKRYGPIFRLQLLGYPDYVYVTEPEQARQAYATDRTVGQAGSVRRDFIGPLVGENSLLCLDGDEWLRQRKLIGPAFHRRRVDAYEERISSISREHLRRWDIDQPFPLRPRMQDITLEIILQLVIGVSGSERYERLRRLLPELIEAGASPLLWVVPARAWPRLDRSRAARRLPHPLRRFLRLRDEVDALLYEEIAQRRASDEVGADVLSQLIVARDDEDRPMSDRELRDELLTLLEAGHETTATALSWTFERLCRTPQAMQRLQRELDAGEEEYLDAVVKEALRARSVVFDTPRQLTGPAEIGGFTLPAGWYVAPALPLVQHDPAALGDPEEFRPERWLGPDPPSEAWIPFGGGKRHCVGSHLALLELKVVIREIASAYDLEAVDRAPEAIKPLHVTLVPAQLGMVRARRRARVSQPLER